MFGIPLLIIVFSVILGLYFPIFGKGLSPIVPFLQGILIFLSTIKVDFNIYKKYKELLKPFFLGFFTCYLFIPLLFFFVGLFLIKINLINFPLFVGIIITSSVPLAAGSTLIWSKELGGKVEITLLLIVTTILGSPLITPTYIYLFLRDEINVNVQKMFLEMALIIFIPVLISILAKKKFTKNLNSNISFLVMGIIIYIAVSKSVERLDLVRDYLIISILLSIIFIIIILSMVSILSKAFRLKDEEKESIFIPSFFKNISLAIIVVSFFEPEVVFFPVVYYIMEQLVSPVYYEIRKLKLNQ
ncbi:MAG: Sodium Bile acid symporter family protein [Candidatus Methanofastidiosum methylothiophilum]|uniref:Sodium Bile acid symporter family protein n=1 Tax=Candidatus Methanofastidiosum methylothiophilum TaxID=1705564 RepID=A0A150IVF6_9EURY|nr:MAG: Sodium Bile acid symporter family protein [Candidatus Methanofastidiosum methylthiophilus]KYC48634.1 MAG: Sodium Bile acid symporter family protein [Candidatus Methanofastidiosum methylthiophilus]KYC51161.1 MAG: Sodium Bile acid symporter family protein [Candidatus Methanofastidiosum methylthiophilus]